MTAPAVTPGDLAAASVLVLANAAIAWHMDTRLARTLVVAAARAIVQLSLVGLVLKGVFALNSPWSVGLVVLVMLASATHEALARQEGGFVGWWRYGLGAAPMSVATLTVAAYGVASMAPTPWFAPQVVVPMVGIVLGTVLNSAAITLSAFTQSLRRDRIAIEAQLALGATRRVALAQVTRASVRNGLIPVINQMSAAGIVTLPGLMTGQILAGLPPFEAATAQIFILLLLAGGGTAGALATVVLAARRATDGRDRLRLERLERQ